MRIRTADLSDLKEIARVEAACFPAAEAATEEEFEKRLTFYKDHFWLMFEEEKLIAFVDGMVTNQDCLLYTSPSPRDRTRSRMPSSA